MNRLFTTGLVAAFALSLAACPGEPAPDNDVEPTEAPDEPTELATPAWMQVDHDARTVEMQVTAGLDQSNNRWNFNGLFAGNATIVVPQGYEVTIEFVNDDPANPHSLAIDDHTGPDWPAMFQDPQPVFDGAMTENPTSMTEATMPGESESITFNADRAGEFTMVCYVPAHAATGMWIYFNVSADGEAGLRTS